VETVFNFIFIIDVEYAVRHNWFWSFGRQGGESIAGGCCRL